MHYSFENYPHSLFLFHIVCIFDRMKSFADAMQNMGALFIDEVTIELIYIETSSL